MQRFNKARAHLIVSRQFAFAVAAALVLGASSPALAVDSRISNAAIYAEANAYPDGAGGGTCKAWVTTVFNAVAADVGSPMRIGDGYYSCYANAGGVRVSLEEAQRGDIVQVYDPYYPESYTWGMHAAIVVDNLGDGEFNVVDSNWLLDGIVRRHEWDLTKHLEEHEGLTVAVWRLGTAASPPAPPPPPPPPPPGEPVPPQTSVHRFYHLGNGTHFYTPSEQERDTVIARWSSIYRYEGVAYVLDPSANTQPLYRFYNLRNASHFYTASEAERDAVIATWPGTFRFEGPTYSVSLSAQSGALAVYRFYNLRNGSHFYTASAQERDTVIARWPTVFRLEGVAFWLGQ